MSPKMLLNCKDGRGENLDWLWWLKWSWNSCSVFWGCWKTKVTSCLKKTTVFFVYEDRMREQWHSDHLPCMCFDISNFHIESKGFLSSLKWLATSFVFPATLFCCYYFPYGMMPEGSPVWPELALRRSLECIFACGASAIRWGFCMHRKL